MLLVLFPLAYRAEIVTSVLLLIPLLGLASAVRRLPKRPDHPRVRRTARAGLRWAWAAAVLLAVKVVAAVAMLTAGPSFARRPLVDLLLLTGPVVLTALRTLPRLRRLAGREAPVPPWRELAETRFALPARLLAVAGGATAVLSLAVQNLPVLLGTFALFAGVAAIVVIETEQRDRRLAGRPTGLRWPRVAGRLVAPTLLVVGAAGCGTAGVVGSRTPTAMNMGLPGQHGHAATAAGGATRSVTGLTGGRLDGPVRRFALTAEEHPARLADGATVDAWTFGDGLPGDPIRVRQGDVVEVTMANHLRATSATVHWHGINVPNAEDGVAGVTQDAVRPGGTFTYRFRADQVGTFWYHSHEVSHEQVGRGLFGAFVVEPADGARADVDDAVLVHQWTTDRGKRLAFGADDGVRLRQVRPGSRVRLRVVNADNDTRQVQVTGASWRLAALDGQDLNDPGPLGAEVVPLGGGGRADVELTMPDHPVRLSLVGESGPAYLLSPDGKSTVDAGAPGPEVDLMSYGRPAPTAFGPDSRFDRDYTVDLDQGFWFHNGSFGFVWTMNGRVFPDVPMLTVRQGELVRVTFRHRSRFDHPMHLHGHRVLLLERDGVPARGSPLWLDSVLVRSGETVTVGFRADNPGIWMDHCHDLTHTEVGMTMHLAYEGVSTPFSVGTMSGNIPE
jgi:FtsP/CotA-like multicopper oxidase with cupredoxin domain